MLICAAAWPASAARRNYEIAFAVSLPTPSRPSSKCLVGTGQQCRPPQLHGGTTTLPALYPVQQLHLYHSKEIDVVPSCTQMQMHYYGPHAGTTTPIALQPSEPRHHVSRDYPNSTERAASPGNSAAHRSAITPLLLHPANWQIRCQRCSSRAGAINLKLNVSVANRMSQLSCTGASKNATCSASLATRSPSKCVNASVGFRHSLSCTAIPDTDCIVSLTIPLPSR